MAKDPFSMINKCPACGIPEDRHCRHCGICRCNVHRDGLCASCWQAYQEAGRH